MEKRNLVLSDSHVQATDPDDRLLAADDRNAELQAAGYRQANPVIRALLLIDSYGHLFRCVYPAAPPTTWPSFITTMRLLKQVPLRS